MRSIIIFSMIFTLVGCAMPQYKTIYETKEVGTDKYTEAERTIISLGEVEISADGFLKVNSYTTQYMVMYEGPKMENISKDRRSADPVGALTNTVLTLGMTILFAPKRTGSQAIGDTVNERVTSTYIDKSRASPTGHSFWRTESRSYIGDIRISGIDTNPIELFNWSSSVFDLAPQLNKTSLQGPLNIKISCLRCEDLQLGQHPNYSMFTKTKYIDFDIDAFRLKQKKMKEIAESEAKAKRIAESEAKAKRIAESEAKAKMKEDKCNRLGLSSGSADFKLCLNSIKN